MKPFLCDDFLLTTPTARTLYHDVAKKQPIVDYHCHLDPQAIYEDVRFENITQLWLGGDHYKWRILRSNGVESSTLPAMPRIGKSSKNLQKPSRAASVTRCTTGAIWN